MTKSKKISQKTLDRLQVQTRNSALFQVLVVAAVGAVIGCAISYYLIF